MNWKHVYDYTLQLQAGISYYSFLEVLEAILMAKHY